MNLICYFAEERVENWSSSILRKMIADPEMERTRNSYASRRLGYGQVAEGDFGLIHPITKWIESVKQTAVGLPTTIQILKQLKASPSKSKHFAIWIQEK